MPLPDVNDRLSRISTMWTMLRNAHGNSGDEGEAARRELMDRYRNAVFRYLLAAVRDPNEADDLAQDFAVRFLTGRFRNADPGRGRFRDYVKTALFRLVSDHRRNRGKERVAPLGDWDPADSSEEQSPAEDKAFVESWRQELLAKAWEQLNEAAKQSGQPYYVVLRYRVENPEAASGVMAEELSARIGRTISAANARQLLHRAREKFAAILLEETRRSLGSAANDQLEDELIELNLLKYCKDALHKPAG